MVGTAFRAAALAAVFAAAGCGSAIGAGDRIVVEVRGEPDLNSVGGTPQPVQFKVVAMKDKVADTDLVQWDVTKLKTLGTVIGDDAHWVWPEKIVSLPPLTVAEKGQFLYLAIAVGFPKPKASILALGEV